MIYNNWHMTVTWAVQWGWNEVSEKGIYHYMINIYHMITISFCLMSIVDPLVYHSALICDLYAHSFVSDQSNTRPPPLQCSKYGPAPTVCRITRIDVIGISSNTWNKLCFSLCIENFVIRSTTEFKWIARFLLLRRVSSAGFHIKALIN